MHPALETIAKKVHAGERLSFDDGMALETHADLHSLTTPLIIHYLTHGARERRNFSPLFDARWYCESGEQEQLAEDVDPLLHYLQEGAAAGRSPHRVGAFGRDHQPITMDPEIICAS